MGGGHVSHKYIVQSSEPRHPDENYNFVFALFIAFRFVRFNISQQTRRKFRFAFTAFLYIVKPLKFDPNIITVYVHK